MTNQQLSYGRFLELADSYRRTCGISEMEKPTIEETDHLAAILARDENRNAALYAFEISAKALEEGEDSIRSALYAGLERRVGYSRKLAQERGSMEISRI